MRIPLARRYADYDTKGHVNNAVYLTYFEMARSAAWHEALGMPDEPDFILAEATVRFRSPAMTGEPLAIDITTSEIRTRAWVWRYEIRCTADDRLIAEGSTVQVMYDYESRTPVPIPEELRRRLTEV